MSKELEHPYSRLPEMPWLVENARQPPPPTEDQCRALWRKYGMLPNIARHSEKVAQIATALSERAAEAGMAADPASTRAAGLLHDIAKTWCLRFGGSHAVLGAAWTVAETGNYAIAQGVLTHVHWPWRLPEGSAICRLPFFIIYADKRVMHDVCVPISERFEDLLARYGHTEESRAGIRKSCGQALELEAALSRALNWNLGQESFGCGRL